MEYTLTFKKSTEASETDQLTFEGMLEIRHIRSIKQEIEQDIEESPAIHIVLQNVEQMDLSFIQLLMAIKKSFLARKKPIGFELRLNAEMDKMLSISGFKGSFKN